MLRRLRQKVVTIDLNHQFHILSLTVRKFLSFVDTPLTRLHPRSVTISVPFSAPHSLLGLLRVLPLSL